MDTFFILLGLFLLAFPIIAIVALVKSVTLADQLRRLTIRLADLERRVAQAPPAAAPTTTAAAPEPPPMAPEPVAEAPAEPTPEREPAIAAISPIAPPPPAAKSAVPAAPPPSPSAAPAMSLEERLGTQWAVWVGGIAVALG